jgi:predicted GNAT family acetyltransferase
MVFKRVQSLNDIPDVCQYKSELDLGFQILGAYKDNSLVGYIAYNSSGKYTDVVFIEVVPWMRRQGSAQDLVTDMLHRTDCQRLRLYASTYEGEVFWNSLLEQCMLPVDFNLKGEY